MKIIKKYVTIVGLLSLSSPVFAATPRPLDCDQASQLIVLGLSRHITYDKLTPELSRQFLDAFTQRLLDTYEFLLSSKDIAAIKTARRKANPKRVTDSLQNNNCSFFENQMSHVTQALMAYQNSFGTLSELTRQLSADLDERDAQTAHGKAMANLRKKVIEWNQTVPIQSAATFVAKQHLHRLDALERSVPELVYEELLQAFANTLDPHTDYIPENQSSGFMSSISHGFSGIGATMEPHPLGVRIGELVKGGPAELSGKLKTGDILTAIDGKAVLDEELPQVIARVKGDSGTQVTLTLSTLSDAGILAETRNITLKRAPIERSKTTGIRSSESTINGKRVVRIALESFYEESSVDVAHVILQYRKTGSIDSLVLDLRNNPGGLVNEAVNLMGFLTPSNQFMAVQDREKRIRTLEAKMISQIYRGPLVIAINHASASASEIMAGALSDLERALIVGAKHSYGKGTMQITLGSEQTLLPGILKLTIARFYTAAGDSPQCRGVSSNVEIPGPLALPENQRECAAYKNPVPTASLPTFIYDWKSYVAGRDAELKALSPELQKRSNARMSKTPRTTPVSADEQTLEIDQVAADYANLKKN